MRESSGRPKLLPAGAMKPSSSHFTEALVPKRCGLGAARVFLSVALIGQPVAIVAGEAHYATPSNYRKLLRELGPGDTLRLMPGTYRRGLPVHFLNGSEQAPIVIEGPVDLSTRVIGTDGHNTVSIINSNYVQIRNLVLEGRGSSGDAVKAEGFRDCDYAHHITLDRLRILGHGGDQQRVGISTKCPAWSWVIRNNEIIGAGTGMYLGNSDGNAPFVNGVIENNVIADTLGYNLQIKHQIAWPQDLPDMPSEKGVTIIRHNIFSKAKSSAEAQSARPNVLVGHWPHTGPGIDNEYHIYANLFHQNPNEALFQGEGNVALYNNLFVNQHDNGFAAIAIQPHNSVPRRIRIFNNTVVSRGAGIVVRSGVADRCHDVVANAVFADIPLVGGRQVGNLSKPYEESPVNPNRFSLDPGSVMRRYALP